MSREARREELRGLAERLGLGALHLRGPANFAWYTGGADNRVDHSSPAGVAGLVVTDEAEYVLTDNVEAGRMREEGPAGIEIAEHPWYEGPEDLLRELTRGAPLGSDLPLPGARDVGPELAPLRYVLDGDALAAYRSVGADAAAAMDEAAAALRPEMGEREAAAALAAALRGRSLFAPVLIAASGRRMGLFRHPIPTGEPLGDAAMLVACAERHGLYANLTRVVYFEEPDGETARRQQACESVLHKMRDATRPGRSLADLFDACKSFYAEEGFPDGWRGHHQGGLTGYASREVVATPHTKLTVRPGMAFAWNPSLAGGGKAEETFVLGPDGPEVLSA